MHRAWIVSLWLVSLAIAFGLGTARRSPDVQGHPGEVEMYEGVSKALTERDYFTRNLKLANTLSGLDRSNLIGALDAYEAQLDTTGEPEILLFMHAWAHIDPAGAFERVQTWHRVKRNLALAGVTLAWARLDPRAAAAAVDREGDSIGEAAHASIVYGWAISGEPGVEAWIARRPDGALRTRMVSTVIVQRLRENRDDEVIAWAESVPPRAHAGLKRIVFKRTANLLGAEDPERTAAWLEPHLGEPYARAAPRELLRKWLPVDPEAAFAWIGAQPDDAERSAAIEAAVQTWIRQDPEPERAEQWFESATRTPLHDPGLVAIADEFVPVDPRRALAWAERIQDDSLRVATLTRIGATWARRSPDEARTWLRTSSLSAETRRELRAAMEITPVRRQRSRGERGKAP